MDFRFEHGSKKMHEESQVQKEKRKLKEAKGGGKKGVPKGDNGPENVEACLLRANPNPLPSTQLPVFVFSSLCALCPSVLAHSC